jgi:hypothetical protein
MMLAGRNLLYDRLRLGLSVVVEPAGISTAPA